MNRYAWMLIVAGTCAGCGSGTLSNEERLKKMVPDAKATTAVTGEVFVDGIAVSDLFVYLIPKGSAIPKDELPSHRGQVKDDGSFAITTYLEGDGAPAGDYVVLFEWLKFRQTGSSWVGPDILKNRYNDPAKSEFTVTVGSEPVVLPRFDLKLEGQPPGANTGRKMAAQPRESKHDGK